VLTLESAGPAGDQAAVKPPPLSPPRRLTTAAAAFSPSDVGRVLNVPGATVRSWQKRGLIPLDPAKLVRQHRHLCTIDVFYLAVLSQILAAGLGVAHAGAIAQAVIYGDGKPTGTEGRGRVDIAPPSLERIRACQRDHSHAAAHVRHRDETAPCWLLYEHDVTSETTAAAVRAAVLPWSSSERYARQHEHFGCLNLTALLARIERGLTALCQQRMMPAARERN
jgi:hypothetical protein